MIVRRIRGPAAACLLALAVAAAPFVEPAAAGSLATPQGKVILTISGSIDHSNAHDKAELDRAMLEAMPLHSIETSTPWTEGVVEFQGVLARDLMAAVGARGEQVSAIALNDYRFKIPLSDFDRYDVVLAYRMNGERLRIRDKGPLWIVYPMDHHQALQNEATHSKMVWQLRRLVVE